MMKASLQFSILQIDWLWKSVMRNLLLFRGYIIFSLPRSPFRISCWLFFNEWKSSHHLSLVSVSYGLFLVLHLHTFLLQAQFPASRNEIHCCGTQTQAFKLQLNSYDIKFLYHHLNENCTFSQIWFFFKNSRHVWKLDNFNILTQSCSGMRAFCALNGVWTKPITTILNGS